MSCPTLCHGDAHPAIAAAIRELRARGVDINAEPNAGGVLGDVELAALRAYQQDEHPDLVVDGVEEPERWIAGELLHVLLRERVLYVPAPDDLGELTVAQLRARALEQGISVPKRARKSELVAALEEAPAA